MKRMKDALIYPPFPPIAWRDKADGDDAKRHRGRSVQVYKEGEDQPSSGFQKGDEI